MICSIDKGTSPCVILQTNQRNSKKKNIACFLRAFLILGVKLSISIVCAYDSIVILSNLSLSMLYKGHLYIKKFSSRNST